MVSLATKATEINENQVIQRFGTKLRINNFVLIKGLPNRASKLLRLVAKQQTIVYMKGLS